MLQCWECGKLIEPDQVQRREVEVGQSTGMIDKPGLAWHTRTRHYGRVTLCPQCAAARDAAKPPEMVWWWPLLWWGLFALLLLYAYLSNRAHH